MRTHRLDALSIAGAHAALSLENGFDFYRVGRVSALAIQFGSAADPQVAALRLECEYQGVEGPWRLALLFSGVRELILGEMRPALFLSELEIEDVTDRGLEGIRYEVIAHGNHALRCLCREIAIERFDRLRDGP